MTCDDNLRLHLGAYVIGGLSDHDHRAFAAHLRTCQHCQVEAAQLSGLPRLLDLVDDPLDLADPVGSPHDRGPEPSRTLLTHVRIERRRRRTRLLAAAAVLGVALLGIGWFVGVRVATPVRPAATQLSAAPQSGSAAQVDMALVSKAWGTELQLTATKLPTQGHFTLWVVDDAGTAVQVATWGATPAGAAILTAASAVPTPQIRAVEVRADSGQTIAAATT
ncbi:MAG: anti-sigma factor family protein [Dermatophilaceae bacterium]